MTILMTVNDIELRTKETIQFLTLIADDCNFKSSKIEIGLNSKNYAIENFVVDYMKNNLEKILKCLKQKYQKNNMVMCDETRMRLEEIVNIF